MEPRDVALIRERLLTAWPSAADDLAEVFQRLPVPDYLPAYGWASWTPRQILTAADGDLWALQYGGLSTAGPEWIVYRAGIGQVGTATAPDDVVLYDVSDILAAVVKLGEYREEVVELRRVRRR